MIAPALLLAALLQSRAGPPAPTPSVPPTRMGVELLSTCPLVVVARTVSTRAAGPGIELLHVSVVERLLGAPFQPGDVLSVLTPAGQFAFGSEDLLFLKPWRGDERYEVALRVAATDPQFEAKLALTRRMVWLMEIHDEQQRIEATLSLVLEQLHSEDEWTRSQGLEELRWMTERLPGIFTAARRARLLSAGRVTTDAKVLAGVEAALRRLRATDDGLREQPPKEQSRP
jgi:hypothetical protein